MPKTATTRRAGRTTPPPRRRDSEPGNPAQYRLNVNLSPTTFEELQRLRIETGQTMTSLVRLAFTLLDHAIEARRHGYRLALVDHNGTQVRELVLPV